jgi:hypothetical protein
VLIPLAICLLFFARTTCEHFHNSARNGSIIDTDPANNNNSSNLFAQFECPPGIFNRLEEADKGSLHDFSPHTIFSVIMLMAISIVKGGEFLFFFRLMRKIRQLIRDQIVEMDEVMQTGKSNGEGSNWGKSK